MRKQQDYMLDLLKLQEKVNKAIDLIDEKIVMLEHPDTNEQTFGLLGRDVVTLVKLLGSGL